MTVFRICYNPESVQIFYTLHSFQKFLGPRHLQSGHKFFVYKVMKLYSLSLTKISSLEKKQKPQSLGQNEAAKTLCLFLKRSFVCLRRSIINSWPDVTCSTFTACGNTACRVSFVFFSCLNSIKKDKRMAVKWYKLKQEKFLINSYLILNVETEMLSDFRHAREENSWNDSQAGSHSSSANPTLPPWVSSSLSFSPSNLLVFLLLVSLLSCAQT